MVTVSRRFENGRISYGCGNADDDKRRYGDDGGDGDDDNKEC
jgi:hypothetical protein